MTPAQAAAANYMIWWAELRDEALEAAREARLAPGPLAARTLRNQAALLDQYAVIVHHAAWREEHPDPERGVRYYSGDRG